MPGSTNSRSANLPGPQDEIRCVRGFRASTSDRGTCLSRPTRWTESQMRMWAPVPTSTIRAQYSAISRFSRGSRQNDLQDEVATEASPRITASLHPRVRYHAEFSNEGSDQGS